MPGSDRISELFDELAGETGREFAMGIKSGVNPEGICYAAFGMGVQFALELAQLSPELARQLIEQIHLEHQDSIAEWNKSATIFIKRIHEA